MIKIILTLNNYTHDLASGYFAALAWVGFRWRSSLPPKAGIWFNKQLALALTFIILTGIPRVIFFKSQEFIPATEKGLLLALLVKHVLIFSALGFGGYFWKNRRISD